MRPLKAVRKKCLSCAGSSKEVRLCHLETCPLHSFRLGKSKGKKILKAIKDYCFECSAFSRSEVINCNISDCPLYEFRTGKNPKRSGIGNKEISKLRNKLEVAK